MPALSEFGSLETPHSFHNLALSNLCLAWCLLGVTFVSQFEYFILSNGLSKSRQGFTFHSQNITLIINDVHRCYASLQLDDVCCRYASLQSGCHSKLHVAEP